jgi:hypothetical protein
MIVFSTNGAGTIVWSHVKEWTSTFTSHNIQKLTKMPNRSKCES